MATTQKWREKLGASGSARAVRSCVVGGKSFLGSSGRYSQREKAKTWHSEDFNGEKSMNFCSAFGFFGKATRRLRLLIRRARLVTVSGSEKQNFFLPSPSILIKLSRDCFSGPYFGWIYRKIDKDTGEEGKVCLNIIKAGLSPFHPLSPLATHRIGSKRFASLRTVRAAFCAIRRDEQMFLLPFFRCRFYAFFGEVRRRRRRMSPVSGLLLFYGSRKSDEK